MSNKQDFIVIALETAKGYVEATDSTTTIDHAVEITKSVYELLRDTKKNRKKEVYDNFLGD